MKKNLVILITLLTGILSSCSNFAPENKEPIPLAAQSSPRDYSLLLKKYVTSEGVNYHEWAQSPTDLAKLNNVSEYYAKHNPPTNQKAALAWYLNAYNALILQQILAKWPNDGPLDVSLLFFHKKRITISGKRMSLLHLENKIIREKFTEPRIHFALNCASRSCPPLHNKPFQANNLEQTLQTLTVDFLNNNSYALIETDDEVQLSKIFEWFKKDFGGKNNLIPYINQYREENLPLNKKVKFLSYNWKINSK